MTPSPGRAGMRDILREAALDAWAVLLPVECVGCETPDRSLCDGCATHLEPGPLIRTLPDGLEVVTALRYEGVARAAVLALKEQHRTELVRPLAPALGAALAAAWSPGAMVVPVLGGRRGYRARGFDPVVRLLRRAGVASRPLLGRPHAAATQKGLGRADRIENARAAFRARVRLDGLRVLLVDDVVTTGATLAAAADAVRSAGGVVAGAVALADTPRRSGGSEETLRTLTGSHR